MKNNHIITTGLAALFAAASLFLASSLVSSCSKESGETQQMPTKTAVITFSISGAQSGGMPQTKGTTLEEGIGAILQATKPTGTPILTIKSKTISSRKYTAEVGEQIALPLDTYTVTGTFNTKTEDHAMPGTLHKTPPYQINQTITVTEESAEFPLTAQYTCFALILDTRQCTKYQHTYINNAYADLGTWYEADSLKIIYLKPEGEITKEKPYYIKAFPVNLAEFEKKEYKMVSEKANGYVQAVNGKWYLFSPQACDTASGDLGISLPDWQQGATE